MKLRFLSNTSVASSAGPRLVPARHVQSTVHGTRTVLLDPLKDRYYSLDEVGTRVWSLLSEGRSIEGAIAVLEEEYEAAPGTVRKEVEAFVRQMRSKRLVETE